ncbi:hypothetical protein AFM11_30385 [Mycolicibacterium wolinskyi]|uniref:RacO protein n=1 Tax=Mycolicibacterium wolinskyi TaxID=59750 RepID=A0A132PER3_9MYCO|nr:DUF6192 family protein [Mycolicibacterium wolinskyi]KWX20482.1 hypothetical protein AFM11_30385 [Mycolicibacterium wolinskyi]
MSTKIGNVTQRRYDQLVSEGRDLVKQQTRCQFALGDRALEIEPLRRHGGAHAGPGEELFTVGDAIAMYADDIGIPASTFADYRWVSSRWPKKQRVDGVSHYVHKVFAGRDDRFELIRTPPRHARTGERRWSTDEACRRAGWTPRTPVTAQEKVNRIHDLTKDDTVAVSVARDLLKRPNVAFEAMADHSARHAVNSAQYDHSRQVVVCARQRTPAIQHIEHSIEYLDLVGACAQFVSSIGRTLPGLRVHEFTDDEKAAIVRNVERVRSTADWIAHAIETGDVSLDEALAELLKSG